MLKSKRMSTQFGCEAKNYIHSIDLILINFPFLIPMNMNRLPRISLLGLSRNVLLLEDRTHLTVFLKGSFLILNLFTLWHLSYMFHKELSLAPFIC